METVLSIAPFLEQLPDRSVLDFLAQQLRKGQLRMHRFGEAAVFLGEENKVYWASVGTNSQTGEKTTKIEEILSESGHRPCQLAGTKTHDVAALQLIGALGIAIILNQLLERFWAKSWGASQAMPFGGGRGSIPGKVVQVACSADHELHLTVDGRVFTMGMNDLGQLGLGHTKTQVYDFDQFSAHEVQLKAGSFATFIACGAGHSIVICEQETVHAFGDNSEEQLGLATLCASILLRHVTSENLCATLERCIEVRFHMLAVDLVQRGISVSNVCDILNMMSRVEEANKGRPKENNNAKDEVDDLLIRYINDIGMAFAAQNAVAVVEGPKFAELNPIVAKDLLKVLGMRKLLGS
eukprot:Skav206318  [mRNA]  locus=scaffold1420:11614:13371:+ [translate_table: standard]